MRLAVVLLVVLVPAVVWAGEKDVRALSDRLLVDDLDVALEASGELRALGAEAKPALPALILALDRRLDPRMARLHWHPWMAVLPKMQLNVIATLEAIGPDARAAVPQLAWMLGGSNRHFTEPLVKALLTIGPDEDESFRALDAFLQGRHWRLTKPTKERVLAWIEGLREKGTPILASIVKQGQYEDPAWAAARLAKLGARGVRALSLCLDRGVHGHRVMVIKALVDAGRIPPAALSDAMDVFASGVLVEVNLELGRLLVEADAELAPHLADALASVELSERAWGDLEAVSPEIAAATASQWFVSRRPKRNDAGFDEKGRRRTRARGGGGGGSFEDVLSSRATLVGFRVTTGNYSGHPIIRSLQPLYDGPEGKAEGAVHGRAGGAPRDVVAPDGYAVGGIFAKGGHRVDGFAVVFFRWRDGKLDSSDVRLSPWIGGWGGGKDLLLGGAGYRIVGVFGRQGQDLDALGLIEARDE